MELVNKLFSEKSTCVLSSISPDGKPMAATVGFYHNKKFQLVIATNGMTQKFKNITNNPNVAVVVGLDYPYTVQYEGTARVCTPEELGDDLAGLFKNVPAAKKLAATGEQKYFLISPEWIRYTDLSDRSNIFETREL